MTPPAQLERRTIEVAGGRRGYLLCLPPGTPTGIVLSLHGRGATARMQASFSRMDHLAAERGAVVLFPQGAVAIDRRGYTWDRDVDVDYLARLILQTRSEYPAAPRRVCVAGMSAGAFMASVFAAARSDDVAVLGAVAGLRAPIVTPSRPVPVVAFHGMMDRALPYRGGPGSPLKERVVRRQNLRAGRPADWPGPIRREAVPEAARAWARANGVDSALTERSVSPTLRGTFYGAGTPGEVTLWTFADAGHTWPGQPVSGPLRVLLGHSSPELDATEEIWRCFERHA